MKVLFITDQLVNGYGGGSLSAQKVVDCLKHYKSTSQISDYLIMSRDNFPNELDIKVKKTRSKDIFARVCFKSNFIYFDLKRSLKKIKEYSPDTVILHNSRFGFAAKMLKKALPNVRIITFFENIEADYCKGAVSKLAYPPEHLIVKKEEKKVCDISDSCIFLTERDKNRASELYHNNFKNSMIFPVTLRDPDHPLTIESEKPSLILLGTLSYGPNKEAVYYFINDILPHLKKAEFNIIVAGKNADDELKELCHKNGIELIDGFRYLSDFCPKYACLVSPLKHGAGMKTKVAEALSYGMAVIGTDETFVGYENLLKDSVYSVFMGNTRREIIKCIEIYSEKYEKEGSLIGEEARREFTKHCKTSSFYKKFAKIVIK